jgi:hypothetical protein
MARIEQLRHCASTQNNPKRIRLGRNGYHFSTAIRRILDRVFPAATLILLGASGYDFLENVHFPHLLSSNHHS